MIHTNELMLGNWVEYAVGNGKRSIPMQVTGIFSDTVYLNFEGNEGDVFEEEEENLLGIPLTEELAKYIGFNESAEGKNRYWYESVGGRVTLHFDTHSINLVGIYGMVQGIYYLHQLQNAYFMLTGKQLEVRL